MFCSCPGNRFAVLKKNCCSHEEGCWCHVGACLKPTFKNLSLHLPWMKTMPSCAYVFLSFFPPSNLLTFPSPKFQQVKHDYINSLCYYINSKYLCIMIHISTSALSTRNSSKHLQKHCHFKNRGGYLNIFYFIDIWLIIELNEIPVYITVIPTMESSLFFQPASEYTY